MWIQKLSSLFLSLLFSCTSSQIDCVSRTEQEIDSHSDIDGDSDVKSSSLKFSDIDKSVVRSSKLKHSDVESGSSVNGSILAHSEVKDGSNVVCSIVKHSEILERSRVEKSAIKHSDITNSTILNTVIAQSEIKQSSIKNYQEEILCFEIEYCNNRENITEGKVHNFFFFILCYVILIKSIAT